jgi:anti-anti-sigma factor
MTSSARDRGLRRLLHVREDRTGRWTVLRATGDLDLATAPRLAVRMRELTRRGTRELCVDMTAIAFADSAGLACLIDGRRALDRVGGRLVVVAPASGPAADLLSRARQRGLLEVAASLEAATR